jgi:transaldolase
MKIFVDTANLDEIEEALKRGFACGITTNPGLLAKEPRSGFEVHIFNIVDFLKRYGLHIPLSVEVFSRDTDEIIRQARRFKHGFGYDNIVVKIQIGWNELEAISILSKDGVDVNCTACMSVTQAVMAAAAGARYVSLFWGRIRDGGTPSEKLQPEYDRAMQGKLLDSSDFDPAQVVSSTRGLLDASYPDSEIIVGSIRTVLDIRDAANAGAHIVTIPPKFFPGMVNHFKTDEVVEEFLDKFRGWIGG